MGWKIRFYGSLGTVRLNFGVVGMLPYFDHAHWLNFGIDFWLEKKGIWTSVLHGNCSCKCDIDVRLLNHTNWTSIAQVMVHFPRLPQVALF